jgi:hypothetical protein
MKSLLAIDPIMYRIKLTFMGVLLFAAKNLLKRQQALEMEFARVNDSCRAQL